MNEEWLGYVLDYGPIAALALLAGWMIRRRLKYHYSNEHRNARFGTDHRLVDRLARRKW